ncbi:MAG: PEGA domain-containing protein [Candidatus Thiodiazotropha sp.]
MGKQQTPRIMHLSSLFTCLTLLQACSGIGAVSGDMPLKVESDPPGATVHILGKAVGETPITLSQQQLYPPGYEAGSQQNYGSLSFSKEGCEDLTKRVHYRDFSSGVSAALKCEETNTVTTQPSISPAPPPLSTPTLNEGIPDTPEGTDGAAKPGGNPLPASAEQPIHKTEKDSADKQSTGLSIKQRLQRIDNLKREGIISEQEYLQARKKILDEL